MYILVPYVLLSQFFVSSGAEGTNPVKLKPNYKNGSVALKKLFDNYDKRLRPYYREKTLYITVQSEVVSFKELDELAMQFGMDMFFRQTWHDPRLAHKDAKSIILSGKLRTNIWLPDTFFYNIKEAKHHTVPDDNSRVEILTDGTVIYSSRFTITASCGMDFREYPMDTQTCMWEVLSYSFKNVEIDYNWGKKPLTIFDDELAQFSLQKSETHRKERHYLSGSYTHLVATFVFHRQLAYSFIQVYIPTAMVVGLSYLSFWVQKTAVPARIALGITTVLTLVTLMGSLRTSVPKVSYIKAIDWYLIVGFLFIFGALLEYVLVLSRMEKSKEKVTEKEESKKPSSETPEQQAEFIVTETKASSLSENGGKNSRRRKEAPLRQFLRGLIKDKFTSGTGMTDTDLYDKVCRIAYPIVFIVFNIAYWAAYATE